MTIISCKKGWSYVSLDRCTLVVELAWCHSRYSFFLKGTTGPRNWKPHSTFVCARAHLKVKAG